MTSVSKEGSVDKWVWTSTQVSLPWQPPRPPSHRPLSRTLHRTSKWSGLAHPERRSYEDDAVSPDKQHGDVPLGWLKKQKDMNVDAAGVCVFFPNTSTQYISQNVKNVLVTWWNYIRINGNAQHAGHNGLQLRIQKHRCQCRIHRIVATGYHLNFSIKCAATQQPTSRHNTRQTARCFTDAEMMDDKLILALSKMKERKQGAEEEAWLDIGPEFVIPDDATTACLHTAKIKSDNLSFVTCGLKWRKRRCQSVGQLS